MILINKKHWWKTLAVLLLLFVIIGGFYFPLSPGIKSYSPVHAITGDSLVVFVETDGGHFKEHPENLQSFLVFDSVKHISASSQKIIDNNKLSLTFFVPSILQSSTQVKLMDIYINSDFDGDLYLPAAITIKQGKDTIGAKPLFSSFSQKIKIKNTASSYFSFPDRELLNESIRNLFFHVPMWFGMTILLLVSMIFSLRTLMKKSLVDDAKASAFAKIALLMGILGIITGAMWAKVTWGAWWNNDPKQDAAAVGLLMYLAYFVLRGSIEDIDKRARVAAVTNVLFFFIFIPMIYIVPRLTSSLHPGNGGNPGFNTYDLDNHLRIFFYAAVTGWTLLGVWLATIQVRILKLERQEKFKN